MQEQKRTIDPQLPEARGEDMGGRQETALTAHERDLMKLRSTNPEAAEEVATKDWNNRMD